MTEQILKASPKPDGSATLLKSPLVHKTVSDSDYLFLMDATEDAYWLENEQVIALIHREPSSDVAGRDGELRHILLVPLFEYIEATKTAFNKYYATPETIPEKLESLNLAEAP